MDCTIQPEMQTLKDFHILSPVRTTLPSGAPLTVVNADEQEVVRMDILFAGRCWQQSQKLRALFTNRMLRKGTQKYTAATIAEKLDYYGSWLELSSSSEYVYITVYSLNKYLARTLEIMESMIKEPVFLEKELHTILDTNIQQYPINASKIDFLAHRGLLQALYEAQHPCRQIIVEKDYHTIAPEVLRDFYGRHYHSDSCSIFLSGKATGDIIHRVTGAFGTSFEQYQLKASRPTFSFVAVPERRVFTEHGDALQNTVRMGCTTITRQDPNYPRLHVLITLFGGYFGSRSMSNIREERGYTYGISAGTMFYPDSGLQGVSTETDDEYVEPLMREVYNEIDKLHRESIPMGEPTMIRNCMLSEMCRSYESPFSLVDAWIFIATSGLDDQYFSRSLQAVDEVTPQEIQELTQRYLYKETLEEVIAGKKLP